MTDLRIGHGYDVHQLTAGRALILGGGFPNELWIHQTGIVSLWAAAVLTLVTGYDYLRVGLKHMD